ncbi:MAG TPA: DUF1223 domain-containing protein, partial [Terriglobales bacterium]
MAYRVGLGLLLAAVLGFVFARHRSSSVSAAAGPRAPVLVELFTSEGCSSCPPADELLARLDREQSIDGSDVIVLGEHVDYWDRLGWKDRFSSPTYTQRQTAYAERLGLDSAYTPQAVVNGRTELVASDSAKLRRAVTDNAHPSQVDIALTQEGESVHVRAKPLADFSNAHVFLAITQSGATSEVKSGENGGRTLHHAPVVLQFSDLGPVGKNIADVHTRLDASLAGLKELRAVGFV